MDCKLFSWVWMAEVDATGLKDVWDDACPPGVGEAGWNSTEFSELSLQLRWSSWSRAWKSDLCFYNYLMTGRWLQFSEAWVGPPVPRYATLAGVGSRFVPMWQLLTHSIFQPRILIWPHVRVASCYSSVVWMKKEGGFS